VSVSNHLACLPPGGSKSKPENSIIQARFQEAQQVFARNPFFASSLLEQVLELPLQNTVNMLCLLLFFQLRSILAFASPPFLAVLAGRVWFALE